LKAPAPSEDKIVDFLKETLENTIEEWVKSEKSKDYWRTPLLAVASADDPLFEKLHEAVHQDHAMPGDLLPGARSVIVFFLPFKKELGQENHSAGAFASRSWAEAYVTTNSLIADINSRLKSLLENAGHRASTTPATHNFDSEKLISFWSHKHLAYIAGLGTFGHNRLLITASGCCGRLGSLVTTAVLPATPRPGKEWCLLKAGERCMVCVSRCKYGALEREHFDRHACYAQCLRNDAHHGGLPTTDVCGKCACEVPCSYQVPEAPRA
jgi:epoxyqueuosine reductase